MFYKDEGLALYIDGTSLHSAARALGFEIDYKKLRSEFMARGRLIRMNYYTCVNESDEYTPLRPLTDWLDYNGYSVTAKTVREYTDPQGRRKLKGSIGIEMTTDAMQLASATQHAVIFTGDGDYKPLVAALQRNGVRVTVCSTLRSDPPMISDELRRQADNFIDLFDIQDLISRPPRTE